MVSVSSARIGAAKFHVFGSTLTRIVALIRLFPGHRFWASQRPMTAGCDQADDFDVASPGDFTRIGAGGLVGTRQQALLTVQVGSPRRGVVACRQGCGRPAPGQAGQRLCSAPMKKGVS